MQGTHGHSFRLQGCRGPRRCIFDVRNCQPILPTPFRGRMRTLLQGPRQILVTRKSHRTRMCKRASRPQTLTCKSLSQPHAADTPDPIKHSLAHCQDGPGGNLPLEGLCSLCAFLAMRRNRNRKGQTADLRVFVFDAGQPQSVVLFKV